MDGFGMPSSSPPSAARPSTMMPATAAPAPAPALPPAPAPAPAPAPPAAPRLSPQRTASPPTAQQHRRGYQACDPCRKRKVKCDLGSVDNPRPPPCVRCRRESKRCEFSATRRKRRASEDADDSESVGGGGSGGAGSGNNGNDSVLRRDKRMMSADGSAVPVDLPPPPPPPPAAVAAAGVDTNSNHHRNPENDPSSHPGMFKTEDYVNPQQQQQRWAGAPPPPPSSPPPSASLSQRASFSSDHNQYYQVQHQQQQQQQPYQRHRPSLAGQHPLESGQHMMNKTAADLLSPAISNTHDALHLLSEAAGRTEDLNRQRMEYQQSAGARNYSTSPTATAVAFDASAASTAATVRAGESPTNSRASRSNNNVDDVQQGGGSGAAGWYDQRKPSASATVDSAAVETQSSSLARPPKSPEQADYANARRVWSRLRFIRAGWFSVDEAMAYITYYYKHLAPLGPIVLPDFSSPSTHVRLLMEEPVLTVTMLTIASRHMELTGNGANCRAYSIHEKLWSYLRGMIERLFWGQEKFGHGSDPAAGFSKPRQFSLDSGPPTSGQGDLNGHLRSLGTVEALLLLTDWHPRALHFPPGDDENTLLDLDAQILTQVDANSSGKEDDKTQGGSSASEGRLAFYKWLEPVWRSDRMSWMLLSTAQALAFELGVFDYPNDLKSPSDSSSSAEEARKRRVRRLILVYISQSSGRLGIPSMLPLPHWNQNTEADHAASHEDYAIDLMQDCWMDISKIMHVTNLELFLSKEHTSNLIKSGQYRDQINKFLPSLNDFKQKIDARAGYMTPQMRCILCIEYEYTRLYVNCLALQAVVDRWTTIPNDAVPSNFGSNQAGGPMAPLRVLMEQYELNEPYIQEVVDASRRILQLVLDGLVPGDNLKHAPVRTFFRILSGMIFILKTFTLGAKEDDVRVSLDLQDRMVDSLQNCIVDDVHVSITIAALLQLLTASIRERFLRFAPFDRVDQASPSRERTPAPASSSPQAPKDQGRDYRWLNPPLQHQQQQPPQQQQQQQQQQPTQHGFSSTNSFAFDNPNSVQDDPLANIPAQPINAPNLNVSFMPPPPSVFYNYYDPGSTGTTTLSPKPDPTHLDSTTTANSNNNHNNNNHPTPTAPTTAAGVVNPDTLATANGNPNSGGTMSDWLALPIDKFFNSSTAGVEQGLGGTGPMVGEFDMLEVLLKEQYSGGTGDGSGQFL